MKDNYNNDCMEGEKNEETSQTRHLTFFRHMHLNPDTYDQEYFAGEIFRQ